MNRYWNLREELYNLFHRWQILLAAILIGCLFGWGMSWFWPAHYRATSQIYIALNPYRKFSDTLFEALANPKYSNLDNYHYWQMSQLESAIFLDGFLEPTLNQLRAIDPYWENEDIAGLRQILGTNWRSTGTWDLIANHKDPTRAIQAAQVWSDVVVKQVVESVAAARRMFMIDMQLQAGETKILETRLRLQDLTKAQDSLEEWQILAAKGDPSIPLDATQRWRLSALVSQPAEFTPAWMNALDGQPEKDAPLQEYRDWAEQIEMLIEVEKRALSSHLRLINAEQTELAKSYSIESHASRSFSPNIEVERKEDLGTRLIRPTPLLLLVGGIIGLLIGLLIQLVMISSRWKRQ